MRRLFEVTVLALGLLAAPALAPGSAEAGKGKIFWSNFGDGGRIYSAKLGGGGEKEFTPPGATIGSPAGIAADMKRKRLYWTDWSDDKIHYAKFNGKGAGTMDTGGLPLNGPTGLQIDRKANRVYWANFSDDTLIWTRLIGGGGGAILTTGATADKPSGIAIDRKAGMIFWANFHGPPAAANLDGSGSGFDLNIAGTTLFSRAPGIALSADRKTVYLGNSGGPSLSFAKANGNAGSGDLNVSGVTDPRPQGLAVDPDRNRVYWVNSGSFSGATAVAWAKLDNSGGSDFDSGAITASDGAYPILLKKPRISRKPKIKEKGGGVLACTRKRVAPDLPGSHLYRSASKTYYEWKRNGNKIPGEKKKDLDTGGQTGKYRCALIAKNYFGKSKRSSGSLNS